MSETAPVAPEGLELVRGFVNTLDVESDTDALAEPDGLADWVVEHDLGDDAFGASPADVRRAAELREALRALLLANNGEVVEPAAVGVLNDVAGRSKLVLCFDETGRCDARPETGGVDAALARILAIVHRAMADGTWPRLKACRWDDCHWAFYDRSKNQSRSWCSMRVCGNRAKSRAYRRRHG